MAVAASVSAAGTRSITHLSGNETKSAICGPIGTCRLKPTAAKRRSFTSACHKRRSASVGFRRSSRGRPAQRRALGRRAALLVLGQELAQLLRAGRIEHAAARRPLAALRNRRDHAVQRAHVLLRRRHALEDIAQVDAHGAALFLRAEELDLFQFALQIGKERIELLLGRRRRLLPAWRTAMRPRSRA